MVWLGIDLGDARVGLALSDPELTLAHPIGNIQVYGDSFRALDEVIDVIGDESVDHVVIGLPLLLNGEEGKSAKKARRWSVNLEKRLHAAVEDESYSVTRVPTIALVDERLTTVTAHRRTQAPSDGRPAICGGDFADGARPKQRVRGERPLTDNLNDFFSDNAQWVDDTSAGSSFDAALPPQPPKSRRDMRKRREQQRRRRYVTIIAAAVVVILVVVGGFFGVRMVKHLRQMNANGSQIQIEDYTGSGDKDTTFTVETGQGAAEIARNLVKADIVKSESAFTSAVAAAGATLYPGSYALKTHMKAADVVKILSDQSKAGGFAEVKAGERVSDVIANAAKMSGKDVSEFQAVIDGGGAGILPDEAGGKFEGWLEPGSYSVQDKSAKDILKEMVTARVNKLDTLGVPDGSERERIMNIASIAESEACNPDDYGKVARVILNRIDQDMPLGMDSTVAYGFNTTGSKLTDEQLEDGSNVNKGLPPTPISNPGDSAIQAAMNPPEGKWLYFVTTNLKTGETKFVETEDEFWKIRDEYKSNNANAN